MRRHDSHDVSPRDAAQNGGDKSEDRIGWNRLPLLLANVNDVAEQNEDDNWNDDRGAQDDASDAKEHGGFRVSLKMSARFNGGR